MRSKLFLLILTASLLTAGDNFAQTASGYYNVIENGASGDGVTLNTAILQKLIDSASNSGGGTIYFPPGRYLTGSLQIKSNTCIYLAAGSEIMGSTNINDYTPHKPRIDSYNDYFLLHSLFYAERAVNISIKGEGTINGQGSAFKVTTTKKPDRYKNRPFIIRFAECRNVHVEGIFMTSSAMWMQQYLACEDLYISRINVYNHANKNNDMMDIDGCKNVLISDCIGDTDDDGITLKSTLPRLTENVTIKNCIVSSHCNAVKTGTESTGGFKNIVISNIVIKPSKADSVIYGKSEGTCGINISTVDGGQLDGIIISDVIINGPEVPLFVRLGNRARKYKDDVPDPKAGSCRNVSISNIIAENVKSTGCSITGIPGYNVENISLNNVSVKFSGGGTKEDGNKTIKELEDQYPESTMWGTLPAYALYIRHASGISLNDLRFSYEAKEMRPAIKIDNAENIKINGLSAKADPESSSIISIDNGSNIKIENSNATGFSQSFISVNDTNSGNIVLFQNDLRGFKKPVIQKTDGQIIMINNLLKNKTIIKK